MAVRGPPVHSPGWYGWPAWVVLPYQPGADVDAPTARLLNARMQFRILGPIEVTGREGLLQIDAGKARGLLARLLLSANEVVPTDRLIDALWGQDPPATAEHAIEVYVSRLRRTIGSDRILTSPPG